MPVAVSSTGTSPLQGCTADEPGTQPGINHAGTEVEAHVDVNPTDGNNVVAAWQQDRWSNGGARGVLVGTSSDGGRSWTQAVRTKTSVCTGGSADNGADYRRATDPWVAFSADGSVYLMTLSIDHTGTGPFGANPDAMLVTKSSDGGKTWSGPVTVIRDEDPNIQNDKNSITADPNDPARAYAVWSRFEAGDTMTADAWFARTLDGGTTWEPARRVFDSGAGGQVTGSQIVVLPDGGGHSGELVNIFTRVDSGGYSIAAIRSEDHGATWSSPIHVADNGWQPTFDPLNGERVRSNRFLPDVAVDPSSGDLHVVWSDARFSDGSYNDVALSTSTDGGLTWSVPARVNRTPPVREADNRQAFTPSVHVSEDETVGVSYYDFRNNDEDITAAEPLETDFLVVHCHQATPSQPDGCADARGWRETRVTRSSFDLRAAPRANGIFLGDYAGLDSMGSGFAALFTAPRSAQDRATAFFSIVRPVHTRAITLRLRRHLVAVGRVKARDGTRECIEGATVVVKRKGSRGWRRAGRTFTAADGSYRLRIADRTGAYRAIVKRRLLDQEEPCLRARSRRRGHRH